MKQSPRFLLKFLGYSLVLFILGDQALHWYAAVLAQCMSLMDPRYQILSATGNRAGVSVTIGNGMGVSIENFLYSSSMTIIAFVALMLSTPGIPVLKRAGIFVTGTIAFFLTDLLFIQYVIYPQGQPPLTEDSPAFEMYLCLKWLMPFLLWLGMSYPRLLKVFKTG